MQSPVKRAFYLGKLLVGYLRIDPYPLGLRVHGSHHVS
jgi:hypothetical protein